MLQRALVLLAAVVGAAPLAAQVTIDFEIPGAPCLFSQTKALREEYADRGVHFSGPGPVDGGAVIDECGGFGLPAHSGVDFLAFNDAAILCCSGGTPTDPETVTFDFAVASASWWIGGRTGGTFTLSAFSGNTLVDSDAITIFQNWAQLSVSHIAGGIDRLVLTSTASVFVADDLTFMPFSALPYCTAKTNSIGCPTTIYGQGFASATATSGFTISADNVLNQKLGMLLYGVTGRAAIPFQGGILCIAPPVLRTPPQLSGGQPQQVLDCSGGYRVDMNEFAAGLGGGSPHALLRVPGTYVHCQIWSRDPGYAPPNASALTSALQYVIGP